MESMIAEYKAAEKPDYIDWGRENIPAAANTATEMDPTYIHA